MTLDLVTALVGVMTSIMLAGIPWAYSIHGRLRSIETKLETAAGAPDWLEKDVHRNSEDLRDTWKEINELKRMLLKCQLKED